MKNKAKKIRAWAVTDCGDFTTGYMEGSQSYDTPLLIYLQKDHAETRQNIILGSVRSVTVELAEEEEGEMTNLKAHAEAIARAAHFGQVDKGGAPRVDHVIYVSYCVQGEPAKIVALLHDTLEDSPLTNKSALQAIFGDEIAEAVDAITRRGGERYFDYIDRCRVNELAREVKIHDITHNLDKSRWPEMPESYEEREIKALRILGEQK